VDFDEVYLEELARLRSLGREFAQEQPMVASYLSGESADPDIERLVQSFAFLTALVRSRLDDEIPEFINDVTSLVGSDIAGQLPSLSVLKLDAQGTIPNGMVIPAGSEFASQPVDGTSCIFSTSWPLIVQPVQLNSCSVDIRGRDGVLTLNFQLQNILLAQWTGDKLSIYLSAAFPLAAQIAYGALFKLKEVVMRFGSGASAKSYPLKIQFPGLDPEQSLYPVKSKVASHLRWARQSLAYPERGFFVEVSGFNSVPKPPGIKDFSLDFNFDDFGHSVHQVSNSDFTLNAVPAVNVFDGFAVPIQRKAIKENYLILPLTSDGEQVEVFDILSVTGQKKGDDKEHEYSSTADLFTDNTKRAYQVIPRIGIRAGTVDNYLRLPFQDWDLGLDTSEDEHAIETLSIKLRCTNGALAQHLRLGEINLRTPRSPEKVSVTNVTTPIGYSTSALGPDGLWKLAAHARLNLAATDNAETVIELLKLYLPQGGNDVGRLNAARRRIEGIEAVSHASDTRLIRGNLYCGSIITLRLKLNYYASAGDLYLFGYLLAYLIAGFTALNTYVSVRVQDPITGEIYEWPYLLSLKQTI
jgi:type VI secretion system protein ImpG